MSTRPFIRGAGRRRQGGSAVVELAPTLSLMMALLSAPVVTSRALLQINVTQRAVGNATRMAAMHPLFLRQRSDVNFADQAKAAITTAMASAGVIAPGADIGELEIRCTNPDVANCKGPNATPEQLILFIFIDGPTPGGGRRLAARLCMPDTNCTPVTFNPIVGLDAVQAPEDPDTHLRNGGGGRIARPARRLYSITRCPVCPQG